MVYVHNWGVRGINIATPPFREGAGPFREPLGWDQLRFGPLGIYDLRRRLTAYPDQPDLFRTHQHRFLTADIAWFAGGTSTDGCHAPPVGGGFFREFIAMRDDLPSGQLGAQARKVLNDKVKRAVFDMTTLWDRAFGGTTIVLHVDGTTIPGTPAEPQYLRASAYLPPAFVDSNQGSHVAIATMVQLFLEGVGVPTVQQWTANARARRWSLTQVGSARPVANPSSPNLIPAPEVDSSHYKFFGRRVGELEEILARRFAPPIAAPRVVSFSDDDGDEFAGDEFDDVSLDIMAAIERAAYAEAQATEYLQQIRDLEQQVDILIARVAAAESLSADLQGQLRSRRADPGTPPTTPARSQRTVFTPSSRPSGSGPPPYSPAFHARSHTDPDVGPDNVGLDALDVCIRVQNLQHIAPAIKLVIRVATPAKWYEELLTLRLPSTVVSKLVDAAATTLGS
ncbi:hypothetical protein B0H12DRAFT_1240243 [Mycena haematopus]|nr:hypothetical protein B0H12DRAFT_1240243 [Mycena haematopus]